MESDLTQTVVGHVKVMRSHDYCHFEIQLPITLSTATADEEGTPDQKTDNVRKAAMRLVDKAVEQYKRAKQIEAMEVTEGYRLTDMRLAAAKAEETPESERTPEQQADIKRYADYKYWKSRDFEYDYEDEDNAPY